MDLRASNEEDALALLDIWRRAVRATHHFLSPEDFAAIEAIVERYVVQATFWVVVDETGRPLGFMAVSAAHIEALFVDPDRHGQGIGARLVAHAARLATPAGVLTVEVNEQNAQAVGFYRHLGFRQTGRTDVDGDGRPYPLLQLRRSL
ncbi:acetyltransferase [Frateuria defendens]|uniref:acetyltransferase n=1 Tax=Frateuria defendens TaxID=2219559 RepID=UPI00066FE020|nr:acetyltransferase [Frateuria defendens]